MRVTAIEPGATMRGAAAPHAHVVWVTGTAEATGLPDQSLDLVLCAQSFHWFRTEEAQDPAELPDGSIHSSIAT